MYSFATEVKATDVVSFYEGQLRNAGWTPVATQPGLPTQWEKGEQTISVSISESMIPKSGQGQKTTIQVISAGEVGK